MFEGVLADAHLNVTICTFDKFTFRHWEKTFERLSTQTTCERYICIFEYMLRDYKLTFECHIVRTYFIDVRIFHSNVSMLMFEPALVIEKKFRTFTG